MTKAGPSSVVVESRPNNFQGDYTCGRSGKGNGGVSGYQMRGVSLVSLIDLEAQSRGIGKLSRETSPKIESVSSLDVPGCSVGPVRGVGCVLRGRQRNPSEGDW